MSQPDTPPGAPTPVRILSLDGGGIRGLSIIITIEYLMKRINPKNPPKPCEYFTLIVGTSTGGLIAIMLGRLRMDIKTCKKIYIQLASQAFQRKRYHWNLLGRSLDWAFTHGSYDADGLTSEMKKMVNKVEGHEDATLHTSDTACRVAVCTFAKSLNTRVLFRSYDTDTAVDTLSFGGVKIWEAARATSAAPTFFDSIDIDLQSFVDGATGSNNPVYHALDEAKSLWKDCESRIQCLVSIGTGVPYLQDFGNNLKDVVNTLKAIATETEETENRFKTDSGSLGIGGRYFRFNVDNGLAGVELDEHEKLDQVQTATIRYLKRPDVMDKVNEFCSARAPENSPVSVEERDKHFKWLPYRDPLEYHNVARQYRKTLSTGDWFLKGQFERLRQPHSFVWLCAKAGSGKTVLSSTVIEEIESQRLGTLAYFYFSFQGKLPQDLQTFKCTLLTQIVKDLTSEFPNHPGRFFIPKAFRQLYSSYSPSRHPKEEDLDATFRAVLSESEGTYIVVDALDECDCKEDRESIVKFLADLVDTANQNIHVLITSRREEDIERAVSNVRHKLIVPMKAHEVNKDIWNHLQDRIKQHPYSKWRECLKAKVINHLVEHADGVFRWADLQLRGLRDLERPQDVEAALLDLPKNLEETYQRMLSKIHEKYRQEAISILRWLAYSRRPIVLAEAAEIAAFKSSHAEFPDGIDDEAVEFLPRNRFDDVFWVRRCLGGLITISGIDDAVLSDAEAELFKTPQNGQISFSHFSVKEYLESDIVSLQEFCLTPQSGQWFIVKSCLAYIKNYDNSETPEKAADCPYLLLPYSCQHLWSHFRKLCESLQEPIAQRYVNQFNSLQDGLIGLAFRLSTLTRTTLNESQSDDTAQKTAASRARQAHAEGLPPESELRALENAKIDIDSTSSLHRASSVGHLYLVKLLLDSGFDINRTVSDAGMALHFAAEEGHHEVVRLLLERGAAIDIPRYTSWKEHGWTPLHSAAASGHDTVVQLLLEWGADVNSGYRAPPDTVLVLRMPLHRAEQAGYEAIAQYLRGKTGESGRRSGKTALCLAAENGHEKVVRLLVEMGANVNAVSTFESNPMLVYRSIDILQERGSVSSGLRALNVYRRTPAYNLACQTFSFPVQNRPVIRIQESESESELESYLDC